MYDVPELPFDPPEWWVEEIDGDPYGIREDAEGEAEDHSDDDLHDMQVDCAVQRAIHEREEREHEWE